MLTARSKSAGGVRHRVDAGDDCRQMIPVTEEIPHSVKTAASTAPQDITTSGTLIVSMM